MSGSLGLQFFLRSLAYQLPEILVCLVAIGLAVVFLKRCPKASFLTVIGAALNLLAHVISLATQAVWAFAERSAVTFGRVQSVVGPMTTLLGAIGLALIVAAVFVGRGSPQASRRTP